MISNEEAFELLKHEINNAIQTTEHKTLAEWPDLRSALKIMGKALTPVDVESLKKETVNEINETLCSPMDPVERAVAKRTIDHLNERGLITGKLPYIEWLEEFIKYYRVDEELPFISTMAQKYSTYKNAYAGLEAAKAYLERMEDKSDE